MGPMHCVELAPQEQALLLQTARASIGHGFQHGGPLSLADLKEMGLINGAPMSRRSTFVTLKKHGELRGCVGSLDVEYPLAVDVARNAFNAAFIDSRFDPLHPSELNHVDIEITVLSPHEPMNVASEAQLLAELEPGRDGLVLECDGRRATFLPQVWEHLPDPRQFVDELKVKAGLPQRFWSQAIKAFRYHAESFAEPTRFQQ